MLPFKTVFPVLLLLNSFSASAQFRKLGFVYSENIRGGAVMFGNTLMYSANTDGSVNTVAMNGNSVNGNSLYDNGNYGATDMEYVDIDGTTGDGAGTRNSSSADLILPAGTNTIKMARLYWGGRAFSSSFDITDETNQTIKIRKDTTGVYTEFPAAQIDRQVFDLGLSTESSRYQAFADITSFIQQQGSGTYTVGNGAFTTGRGGDFGNYGAWCLVVVYENPVLNFNSVRVIDGFQEVYSGGGAITNPIVITGLNVPADPIAADEAQIGVMAWEGDARFGGDFFKINNILFSNALNQPNNAWNGTETIDGVHVTTKNPNYTDQMSLDIDRIYVGTDYGLMPNASSLSLQYGTTQDQYFTGIITAVIKMKEPDVKITKAVDDANHDGIAGAGEVLTYTVKGKNYGTTTTTEVSVTDSLPSTMIYVPNSLRINYSPGIIPANFTDSAGDDLGEYNATTKQLMIRVGNNASALLGGDLAPADSFEVAFKVTFNPVANGVSPPLINVARVSAKSGTGEILIDDATVTINGATAQHINYTFTGSGNWSTPANWAGSKIPPATLPVFSTIIIDHSAGGQCTLDVPQNLATGSTLIVNAGKNFIITGSLKIQ